MEGIKEEVYRWKKVMVKVRVWKRRTSRKRRSFIAVKIGRKKALNNRLKKNKNMIIKKK